MFYHIAQSTPTYSNIQYEEFYKILQSVKKIIGIKFIKIQKFRYPIEYERLVAQIAETPRIKRDVELVKCLLNKLKKKRLLPEEKPTIKVANNDTEILEGKMDLKYQLQCWNGTRLFVNFA